MLKPKLMGARVGKRQRKSYRAKRGMNNSKMIDIARGMGFFKEDRMESKVEELRDKSPN